MNSQLKLTYSDIYCIPVSEDHIHLGWLGWMNDEEILRHLSSPRLTYTEDHLKMYLRSSNSLCFFACYTQDDVYFGNLRIYRIGKTSLSFGRLIGEEKYRGVGYGTKLSSLALNFCLDYLKFDCVIVGNEVSNKASSLSKIKSGFSIADGKFLKDQGIEILPSVEFFYVSGSQFRKT